MDRDERAQVNAAERRFELWRRRMGMALAPALFGLAWFAAAGLKPEARRLAAVLAAVVVLWVSEAIPMAMTALLGVAVAVVLGVAPAAEAFAPFADPLIFLFIGTFMLAQAIFVHRLNERFAFGILGLRVVGARPERVIVAYASVSCFLSMWMSNTATTAMMFPIGLSLLAAFESHPGAQGLTPRYGAALLLSTAFAASIGGLGTPVGTPPNLIGIGFIRRETGVALPFFTWMVVAVPVVVALFLWMLASFRRSTTGEDGDFSAVAALIRSERSRLGRWTRGQVNTLAVFVMAIALWVFPGAVALVAGQDAPLYARVTTMLPEGVVALLAAGLLFVLPTDLRAHQFTLSWEDAVKIDWWIVFLYGGGIALGTMAFRTGLAEALGRGLTAWLGVHSQLGLLAVSTTIATLLSETTSNTAAANMVVPVVIAFARSAGIDPVIPAVGATMGASLGFMLPVSTPTNAIVYASGRIPLTTMIRYGILLDIAGIVAIVAVVGFLGPVVLARP